MLTILRPQSPEVHYLQFRLYFDRHQIEEAIDRIYQLRSMTIAPGTIPLSQNDISDLSIQLPFWQPVLSIQSTSIPVEVTLLTGSTSDELTETEPAPFADGVVHDIQHGSVAQYRVTNHSQTPAHLYFIAIHDDGTLRIGSLFASSDHAFNGLAPGAEGYSHPFAVNRSAGIYETRIYCSPERIDPMLMPPTTA